MKIKTILSSVLAFLFLGSMVAQVDFLTADEFLEMQKSGEEFLILDANKSKNYAASHIKNAVHINHNDLYRDGDIKGLILEPEALANVFCDKGVANDTKVVITDDGSQKYSSRVYWILKYLGKDDVYILHKDMDAWRKARILLTSVPGKAEPKEFKPKVNPMVLANLKDVAAGLEDPNTIIVDSRTADEFNGVKNSEGHIPGAINLNYEDLLTDNGAFKSEVEIRNIAVEYGLSKDKNLIFYCRTSVRATVAFVAFNNILGYENVKVYDGAYLEWKANNNVVQ